jgi:acyl carrier protein
MPSYKSILRLISNHIAINCEPKIKAIKPQDSLLEDLGLESTTLLSLAEKLENEYGIQLICSQDNIPETIDDVVKLTLNLIERKNE